MVDRIKLRHLLDRAQGVLAVKVGLTFVNFGASRIWRDAFGPSLVLSRRLAQARALFQSPNVTLDARTQAFLSSPEGMTLVAEASSNIRSRGDQIAHPRNTPRRMSTGPIARSGFSNTTTSGLQALVELLCDG